MSDPGSAPPGPGVRLFGRVEHFDEATGLGSVATPEGGRTWPFHCTSIAGGGRTIEPGTAVTFVVVAGRAGRWEAADLRE